MITALLAAAFLLATFVVATTVLARDSTSLAITSRIMAWVTLAAAFVLPLMVLAAYLAPDATAALDIRLNRFTSAQLRGSVPIEDRMLAFACAAVPLGIAAWGLLSLRRVFELFATREIFSLETSTALSALSLALLFNVIAGFLSGAPVSYFLTRAGGVAPRGISLSVGSDDLVALFVAAAAAVIARVISEGTRIADENAKFV